MASFELSRANGAVVIAREWRGGKHLPLYLAGLAAGAAIGVVLTFVTPGGDTTVARAPASFEARAAAPLGEFSAAALSPATVEPLPLSPGAALNTFPEIPAVLLAGLASPVLTVPAAAELPALAPAPEPAAASRPGSPISAVTTTWMPSSG